MAEIELVVSSPYSTSHPIYEAISGASKVITKSNGRIVQAKFYRTYDEDSDTLSGLFCEENYTYSGTKLTQVVTTWYAADGVSVDRTEVVKYETDGNVTRELHSIS